MDQLPQSDVATAYIAVEVRAFDEWWATGENLFDFSLHQTWNVIIVSTHIQW